MQTEPHTYKQPHTLTDKQTYTRCTDTTHRQTDIYKHTPTHRHTDTQTDRHTQTNTHTIRQHRQTDIQTDRQTYTQTYNMADIQTDKHIHRDAAVYVKPKTERSIACGAQHAAHLCKTMRPYSSSPVHTCPAGHEPLLSYNIGLAEHEATADDCVCTRQARSRRR